MFTELYDSINARIIDITYTNLVNAINTSALVRGYFYRITDFATVHYIVDGDENKHGINTGAVEPLMVLAVSSNALSYEVRSVLYPKDIIYYDWNPANWMEDIGFSDAENEPATAIIAGFKGVIYFRHDTIQDNYCGYDFRNVKFRRWKTSLLPWNSATTYGKGDRCVVDSKIYVSTKTNNLNNLTSTSFWVPEIDLSHTEYWYTKPQGSAEYADLLTFNSCNIESTYEASCFSNHVAGNKDKRNDFVWAYNATILSNNVFHLDINEWVTIGNSFDTGAYNNTIGPNFSSNSIGHYFSGNITGPNFNRNTIGDRCTNNIFGYNISENTMKSDFQTNILEGWVSRNSFGHGFINNIIGNSFSSNVLGSDCYENVIGTNFTENNIGGLFVTNTIGTYFNKNAIGPYFQANTIGTMFAYNTIGPDFRLNTIGNNFYVNNTSPAFDYNTIGTDCSHNTTGSNFSSNIIANNFQRNNVEARVTNINFSAATHVYQEYSCSLFRRQDGTIKLRYYNNSDTMIVVNANV